MYCVPPHALHTIAHNPHFISNPGQSLLTFPANVHKPALEPGYLAPEPLPLSLQSSNRLPHLAYLVLKLSNLVGLAGELVGDGC